MRRLRYLLADDLTRARVEFWTWATIGAVLSWVWLDLIAWVTFMSWYAIVTSAATKVEAIKAAASTTETTET